MQPNCVECRRLWREYSAVARELVRLDSKLKAAALIPDRVAMEELTHQLESATAMRTQLREEIDEHEARTHGKKVKRGSAAE